MKILLGEQRAQYVRLRIHMARSITKGSKELTEVALAAMNDRYLDVCSRNGVRGHGVPKKWFGQASHVIPIGYNIGGIYT